MGVSPLDPVFVLIAGVYQLHVEERREYKGEDSDGRGSDKLEDGSEARDRLRYKEQNQHREAPEDTPPPV